jgi:hypothetical protein
MKDILQDVIATCPSRKTTIQDQYGKLILKVLEEQVLRHWE